MAVLRLVERVGEVGVALRQHAVEDFAAHDVVLDVALAVAPGERAVLALLEAHHHAALVDALHVVDRVGHEVPADFAGGVDDGVLRIEAPLQGAARRVVPNDARALRGRNEKVVDEVEAILELFAHLHDFGVEHRALLAHGAVAFRVDGRRIDLVGFADVLLGAERVNARVGHFNGVHVVGIEAENRNAAVGEHFGAVHLVGDFRAVLLRNDAHLDVVELVAAAADDGRERRNAVRVRDHFANLSLLGVFDGRTRGTACGEHRVRHAERHHGGEAGGGESFHFADHGNFLMELDEFDALP